jgi:hypothetical protein
MKSKNKDEVINGSHGVKNFSTKLPELDLKPSLEGNIEQSMHVANNILGDIKDINREIHCLNNQLESRRQALTDSLADCIALAAMYHNHFSGHSYKVELIKMLRAIQPLGLKEAKDFIEEYV